MSMSIYEELGIAETRIFEAAKKRGCTWRWAKWSKPSTGGRPLLWHEIEVTYPNGPRQIVTAIDFINGEE